ncbi:Magnesium and cobalt transporter [Schleiferilactobacillus perolens DSM 12744]|uniref:Magnesium and cobalt transporter n=2 Tax=Schleiferilactobacillus perolens TaxID=100468 RepID=A0A0R1MZ68_9LACO|nr:Magnesium and cobalt transporter [Schleiferilactobacillus perolens DSM 12744]
MKASNTMLKVYAYDRQHHQLTASNSFANHTWINVVDPTAEEIATLLGKTDIPESFIYYGLDKDENARTEYNEDDDATLIIFDVPVLQRNSKDHDGIYRTVPLAIVLTKNHLVTISNNRMPFLDSFSDNRRHLNPTKPAHAVLSILAHVVSNYQRYLRDMNKSRERTEDRLQRNMRNRDLYDLMRIQRGLVYFLMSLRTDRLVLEALRKAPHFPLSEIDDDYLEDILTEVQQSVEMAQISNNILNESTDTYSSIINNNMNTVMKFLTVYSILLTIPTLVFSFYGMNMKLPMADLSLSWIITIIMSLIIVALVGYWFYRRHLF